MAATTCADRFNRHGTLELLQDGTVNWHVPAVARGGPRVINAADVDSLVAEARRQGIHDILCAPTEEVAEAEVPSESDESHESAENVPVGDPGWLVILLPETHMAYTTGARVAGANVHPYGPSAGVAEYVMAVSPDVPLDMQRKLLNNTVSAVQDPHQLHMDVYGVLGGGLPVRFERLSRAARNHYHLHSVSAPNQARAHFDVWQVLFPDAAGLFPGEEGALLNINRMLNDAPEGF